MKYIERSGRKIDFSPWRLGDQNTCREDEGRGSHRGGGPWGVSLLALESLVTREKSLGKKNRQRLRLGEREREGFEKKAMVRRFKYPWTHAWSDIVWASWTLSG
jgi:hypothetical protein